MTPFINKTKSTSYDEIYGAYMNLQRMGRTDRYKLIAYPKANKLLLFDVVDDPLEMNDLSENPEIKSTKFQLIRLLKKQQELMEDTLNLDACLKNHKI